jgi:hypothetical protein
VVTVGDLLRFGLQSGQRNDLAVKKWTYRVS